MTPRRLATLVFPLAALILLHFVFVADSPATTMDEVELVCPVCGVRFTDAEIRSTNTFGGVDRDFRPIAAGTQPLLVYPAVCPQCLYAGYPGVDFGPDAAVPEPVKKKILDGKALRKPVFKKPAEAPADYTPVWVEYDLIAQTYLLLNKPSLATADQYLRASWVVRIGSFPGGVLDKALLDKLERQAEGVWKAMQKERDRIGNDADFDILMARKFEKDGATQKGEQRLAALLNALLLYRIHGENSAALRMLAEAAGSAPAGTLDALKKDLEAGVVLERRYQALALDRFEKAVEEDERAVRNGPVLYLIGELHRRLEHYGQARLYYEKAAKQDKLPEYLPTWIKEQTALLPE